VTNEFLNPAFTNSNLSRALLLRHVVGDVDSEVPPGPVSEIRRLVEDSGRQRKIVEDSGG